MRMCCVLLGDCRTCFFLSNNSFLLRVGAVAYSGRGDEPRHYWHMASLAASFLSPLVHSITGGYCYTGDLCQLDGRRPREVPFSLPGFQSVSSPLRDCLPAWRENLRGHPDPCFVNDLLCGIEHGFRVGFDYSRPLRSAQNHMLSADLHPGVVDQYVDGEVAKGRIVGPVAVSVEAARAGVGLHLNRMGVVPKGHTPGKWRLITDLSFPEGGSVNDGIDPAYCSLQYTSVEKIAGAAQSLGRGSLLAKLDVRSAYRLVPVHPADRPLLGFIWKGRVFVDGMLPFGLRSAPKIFTAVADALAWIIQARGVRHVDHYLDDFVTFGPAGTGECTYALRIICQTCAELGVPLAMEKQEGPSSCLTFLGIEIDTRVGVLRLPQEKLRRVRMALARWSNRKSCTRRELESLIGTLQHACRVVRPGRSFLRRMIDLLTIPKKPHHHVRLNAQFQADVGWWKAFVVQWNGVAIIPSRAPPSVVVTSDASGQWGCGAWVQREWFQFQWPANTAHHHIAFKELSAALLAAAVWGPSWRGQRVRWRCDNQAAVFAVTARSCRDKSLMHLLRCLFFFEAHFQFEVEAVYLPGKVNTLADDLSRNRSSSFLCKAPQMRREPSRVPPQLPLLLFGGIDWTSPL